MAYSPMFSIHFRGPGSLLVTVATEGELPSGGVGGALANQIDVTAEAAGIEVTVQVTRFGQYTHLSLKIRR